MAAEFALVVPLFITMLFGSIEYGYVFAGYSSMQSAARLVLRQVAANTVGVDAAAAATKSHLPPWVAGASTVSVTQSDAANPLSNRIRITVQAPVTGMTPLAVFTQLTPWTVSADVSMTQELPFDQ